MNSRNISKEEIIKQEKSTVDLKNLKSDYILIKIFDIMTKKKSLKIIKYNKTLQKRLNISINDYKDYSQLYSSIEIELKVNDTRYDKEFINIPDKEKEYYHIYFDNLNEEIKRNYLEKEEKVKLIKIIIDYQVKSLSGLFSVCNILIQ